MQFLRPSRAWYVCALLTALMIATVATAAAPPTIPPAAKGREFSGYFDVSNIQEQGDMVQVTLHVKIFNHNNYDAKSIVIALVDSTPSGMLLGNFQPVKVWKGQQFLTTSQKFTVTKSEFAQWLMAPAQPNLVILYQDTKGNTLQKTAQLSHRPLF
jgi:hypothetical protein